MGEERHWHLICYDIRDPKRWSRAFKILKGRGEHVQLSIFRAQLSATQLESLRHELAKVLKGEDDLLIVRLCPGCAKRVMDSRGGDEWGKPPPSFEVC